MFPLEIQSDITIFNAYEDATEILKHEPTIIKGVFWDGAYSVNLRSKGITTNDRVSIMILFETKAENKEYITPFEFYKLSALEKVNYWTIAKEDLIINQIVNETIDSKKDLIKRYGTDNVFTVTDISINNYGSPNMKHFKIIAK